MKVALITDGIWPYVLGGMQKHSYYLCKYLAQNKIQVDLFHFNQSNYNIAELEFFTEDEKRYIRGIVVDFPPNKPIPGYYLYASYLHSKRIYKKIFPDLNSYDFIYTKGFTGWYLLNQKRFKNLKAPPVAVKFHGYEMFQKPPDFKARLQQIFLLRSPVRSISKKADVVFSYGGKINEIILSLGVPPQKMVEIPSGVEANAVKDNISGNGKPLRFLFLGRYERRKGIEELNKALSILLNSKMRSAFEFHFVGPIPENKRLKAENIVYHGEIRDKIILEQKIRFCDVLVCPSWSEGFPNVILEAMANGLTVIATNVGAVNVLINNNNGCLIETSDPEKIFEAMQSFIQLGDEELKQKKQLALHTIKNKFTWDKLIVQLINVIDKVKNQLHQ